MDPCNNDGEPQSQPEAKVETIVPELEEAELAEGPPGAGKEESNMRKTIQEEGGVTNILAGNMPAGAGDQEQEGKE